MKPNDVKHNPSSLNIPAKDVKSNQIAVDYERLVSDNACLKKKLTVVDK